MTTDVSRSARTGEAGEEIAASAASDVQLALTAAREVAATLAATSPAQRRDWLIAVADAAQAATEQLVAVADQETGLGEARLSAEVAGMAGQTRFYTDVAAEGSWLGATLDPQTDTAPALGRVQMPLGPVAVFGASNFPFRFGTLGNDTSSAIAAGCPVIVKAHPAHPLTARLLGEIATGALRDAGAPEGTFAQLVGFEAGTALVAAPEIEAVAFTGSQRGGMALWEIANQRQRVIPVYAEMGTVNPVVVTRGGAGARLAEIASGFVGSFTLGMGQFCTKPGLLLAPSGSDAAAVVGQALESAAPQGWMLTEQIGHSAVAGIAELVDAGAQVVAQTPAAESGWTSPATVLRVEAADLIRGEERLLEECFGPVALVVEYADDAERDAVLAALQGSLAAAVMPAGADDPEVPALVGALAGQVGRVTVGDWPTGVAFAWAQQHGGPWPATSIPSATSVGAAALDRFTRPVTFQSTPDAALPPALQAANPWGIPRRVGGRLESPSPEGGPA
ncbi:MAG: aldehyde dehydrogenase family protein [Micrococcales bacterium]|nr:aldehyde dehydrogenase family protein [Micrococcales bacterium]